MEPEETGFVEVCFLLSNEASEPITVNTAFRELDPSDATGRIVVIFIVFLCN